MLITIRHTGPAEGGKEAFQVVWESMQYPFVTLQPPEATPLEGYDKLNLKTGLVWYLEQYLRQPFGPNRSLAQAVEAALEQWGKQTLTTLFSGEAMECLLEARKDLKNLRIRLVSDSPAVLSWPWEAMRDSRGRAVFLHSSIERQPRNIEVLNRLPSTSAESLNILFVIARPGKNDINYHFLSRDVAELVSEGERPVRVDVLRPPSFENLRRTLEARPGYYHIVHFDGHGGYGDNPLSGDASRFQGAEGKLYFEKYEDGQVQPDPVGAEKLGELLGACGVPMMVLNACQSAMLDERAEDPYASVAASLLKARVRSVVAMGYSLYTDGAKAFVKGFYEELLSSGRTELAMREGRVKMYEHKSEDYPLSDWIVPQLYQQAQAEERVLPELNGKTRPARARRLPPEVIFDEAGFIGRGRAIQELERLCCHNPQAGILISGMMGQGKTTLAKGFLRWLDQTGGLGDPKDERPALWLSFQEIRSADTVINAMAQAFLAEDVSLPCDPGREARLAEYLKTHKKIIVWDNFESASGMEGVSAPRLSKEDLRRLAALLRALRGGKSRILITSRGEEPQFEAAVCARLSHPLEELEDEERWALCVSLAQLHGFRVQRDDEDLCRLLERLGGNPLALRSVLLCLRESDARTLLSRFDQAMIGAAGDESTRRIRASFELLLDAAGPELHPVLEGLSLFTQYADTDMLVDLLGNLRQLKPNSEEAYKLLASVERCFALLCAAGFCQRVREGLYQLHPSLRGCLAARFSPDEALRELFVYIVAEAESDNHNHVQTRRAFAACHAANCRRARAIAEERGMEGAYLALSFALSVFADDGGNFAEGEALLQDMAEKAARWGRRDRLRQAYRLLSVHYTRMGQDEKARAYAEKAAGLTEEKPELNANAYVDRANHALRAGDPEQAIRNFEKAAELWEQTGDERAGGVYALLFELSQRTGDAAGTEKWRKKLEDFLPDCRDLGLKAAMHRSLARFAEENGEPAAAFAHYQQAYRLFKALGDSLALAETANMLGNLLLQLEQLPTARQLYEEALQLSGDLGNRPTMALSYFNLGLCEALAKGGSRQHALNQLGEALALYRELGDSMRIARTQMLMADIQTGKFD